MEEKLCSIRTIDKNGRTNIPKEIRKQLDIDTGAEVEIYYDKNKQAIIVRKVENNGTVRK